jgi:hypothetical protein
MARSLEVALPTHFIGISRADRQDIVALVEPDGAATAIFDASYGDTLKCLLPRRLSEFATRH